MIKRSLGSWDSKSGTFSGPEAGALSKGFANFLKLNLKGPSGGAGAPLSLAQPSMPVATPNAKHGTQSLPYGGMPARTPYGVGCKPSSGTTFKKQKRFELIARMENAALPEAQIATLLSISVPRLRSIKQSPEYLKARAAVTLGLIIDTDASLEQIREQRKEVLRQLLPPALQVIANVVCNPPATFAEKRLQVSTAQDLLDREGSFAKISRTEIHAAPQFQWETADASAKQVVDVIKSTLRVRTPPRGQDSEKGNTPSLEGVPGVERILEISRAFSSGNTLSAEQQQDALRTLELEGRL